LSATATATPESRWRAPLLVVVLAGLTLHTLVLMLLFGVVGVPARLITVLSAWKEVLVAVAAAGLILGLLFKGRWRSIRLVGADYLAAGLLLLVLVEGVVAMLPGHLLPFLAVLYGMRFYLVPLAAYAIGRLMPLSRRDLRVVLLAIVVAGAATGAIALAERLLTDQAYVALIEHLGYKAYFGDYVNQLLAGPGPTAASTWVDAGHGIGRRAGSVYLVSKPFALAMLVAVPAALVLLHRATGRGWLILSVLAGLIGLGLSLSYTRAAIAAGGVIAVIVAALLRRWQLLPAVAIGLILGLGVYYGESHFLNSRAGLRPADPPVADSAIPSLSSSDLEHFSVWSQALQASLKRPIFGWGPGAGNEDSQRFILPGPKLPVTLGAESVFLQVAEDLGLVGLALYVAMLLAIGWSAWRLFRRAEPGTPEQQQAIIALALTICVIGVGTTTPIWSGAFVITYVFWWMSGLTVQQAGAERAAEAFPNRIAEA
jgi:hypothetical protein